MALFGFFVVWSAASVAVIWPQLAEQIPKFVDKLPQAVERLVDLIDDVPWVREAIEGANDRSGDGGFDIPRQVLGVFSTTFGTIASVSLIVLIAIYLTLPSRSYVDNLLILIPRAKRKRAGLRTASYPRR